ncbi:leucine-rich repeat-containing protein 71-like [Adelges cooleyi]|uniref:leucine-rich repeat-containing protein 71-like n=1 Tax=Adelges cooleyi TaxID=133065 RepID=UPI00217F8B6B|nr:leucine-rich repeat-containing protein 71-like [Adelges cooleyi]
MIIKGMTANCTVSMHFWNNIPKNISKLTFTDSNIDQEVLGDLGLHLMTNECLINELTLDGIDLSKKNFMCCLPPVTRVKKLWLRFCRLGDAGVDRISETLQCQGDDFCDKGETRTLQLLNLDCNGITCAGVKTLAQVLRANRTLRILSLAKNAIKDEGALALVNVLSKFALTEDELRWKNTRELRRTRILEWTY